MRFFGIVVFQRLHSNGSGAHGPTCSRSEQDLRPSVMRPSERTMADQKQHDKVAGTGAAIGDAVGALIGLVGGPLGGAVGGGLGAWLGHRAHRWIGGQR